MITSNHVVQRTFMQRMNVLSGRDTRSCKKRPLGAQISQLTRSQKDRLFMRRMKIRLSATSSAHQLQQMLQNVTDAFQLQEAFVFRGVGELFVGPSHVVGDVGGIGA